MVKTCRSRKGRGVRPGPSAGDALARGLRLAAAASGAALLLASPGAPADVSPGARPDDGAAWAAPERSPAVTADRAGPDGESRALDALLAPPAADRGADSPNAARRRIASAASGQFGHRWADRI